MCIRDSVDNERGIIDGVPFFAADIDHQLEIDVIIAALVHQLAVAGWQLSGGIRAPFPSDPSQPQCPAG